MDSLYENDLGELANIIYKLTVHYLIGKISQEEHRRTLSMLLERCDRINISSQSMENDQYIVD